MPRRYILTERQRATLLELLADEASLLKPFTLADDDLELSASTTDQSTT
jgi:hypothetical protein